MSTIAQISMNSKINILYYTTEHFRIFMISARFLDGKCDVKDLTHSHQADHFCAFRACLQGYILDRNERLDELLCDIAK